MIQLNNQEEHIVNDSYFNFQKIKNSTLENKIEIINILKSMLHEISPFNEQPVDCVLWVKSDTVYANGWNPNRVATPEYELLKLSIESDGYTQPVVSFLEENNNREIVDGYHRSKIAKEDKVINEKIYGYTPVVTINSNRTDKSDRISSTIRHNRARGKHQISAMSDIVLDLKKRNWSDSKIAKNLGMDADEVLRLSQIGGIAESFKDKDFSEAWEAELYNDEIIE